MKKNISAEISSGLSGKKISVLPYCHADFAWCHTRDWHERRYLMVFDQVIKLFRKNKKFSFFFDSWSEMISPCLKKRPETIPFLKKMLRQGRLAFIGGQWSNIRPSLTGDELFIRNITYGRRAVLDCFPEARLAAYANLDTCIGHSQMPQLLSLGGYDSYFAWRPEHGLDSQGVPRRFLWRGLSGAAVLVNRHSYQGWFHAEEFCPQKGKTRDFSSMEMDFDYIVNYTWKKFLEKPASEQNTAVLSFCQGGDDLVPFTDACSGKVRDIPGIMRQWNRQGPGNIQFGTPADVFSDLHQQRTLPEVSGILDPADAGYNIALNGQNGLRFRRMTAEREMVRSEKIAALAALRGYCYPESLFDDLWKTILTWSTHALEFTFSGDFHTARRGLEHAADEARAIQRAACSFLISAEKNDPPYFTVFNSLPCLREEYILIKIPNIDNSRTFPELYDEKNRLVPQQIISSHPLSLDYEVLVRAALSRFGFTNLKLRWKNKKIKNTHTRQIKADEILHTGSIELQFKGGMLSCIRNRKTGQAVHGTSRYGLLDPVALEQKMQYWMAQSCAETPHPFVPIKTELTESGPLCWRISRNGMAGAHWFRQDLCFFSDRDYIDVETMVSAAPGDALIALSMPLDQSASLNVDIPFGVEARDLSKIKYGHQGGGNYENIERRLDGVFWGRSWVYAAGKTGCFGLITSDGPRYFRDLGKSRQLLHFLVNVFSPRQEGWMKNTEQTLCLGAHTFHHRLVIAGKDWRTARMAERSQEFLDDPLVFPGKAVKMPKRFTVRPDTIRLSAFYRQGPHFIARLYNMSAKRVSAEVTLPFMPDIVQSIDFNGRPSCNKIIMHGTSLSAFFEPWQIMTIKLTIRKN